MKLKFAALLALLAAVATVVIAAPTASAAKPKKATAANVNVPVTGTVANDRSPAITRSTASRSTARAWWPWAP